MLINLMSDAVLLIIVSICRFFIGCVVCSRISIDCSLNQFLSLADTVCNLALNDRFAIKTLHRNLCIGSHDNAIRLGNLRSGQHILGAAGTSGLNLDAVS